MPTTRRNPSSTLQEPHPHEAHDPEEAEIDPVASVTPRPRVSLLLVIEIVLLLLVFIWIIESQTHAVH